MSEDLKKAIEELLENPVARYEQYFEGYTKDKLMFLSVDYRNAKVLLDYIEKLQKEVEVKGKIIERMAEDLTTDYHSKEWIINHYINEVENGSRRSN